jgi:hypothetical protein
MTISGIGGHLFGTAETIFNEMKKGADLCTNPNTSPADIEKFWKELQEVGLRSNQETLDYCRKQIQEELTKHMIHNIGGFSEADADKWFLSHWQPLMKVVMKADKVRRRELWWEHTMEPFKFWLKAVGFVTMGTFIFVVFVKLNDGGGSSSVAPSIQQQIINDIPRQAEVTHQALQETTITSTEFTNMMNELEAPAPAQALDPVAPQAVPAPAEVASVEDEPVTVETGTRTINTTVGHLYHAATAQLREQMEAPKIDHDYDRHDSSHDCSVIHCLTPHKDFTISADFDTGGVVHAHIRY